MKHLRLYESHVPGYTIYGKIAKVMYSNNVDSPDEAEKYREDMRKVIDNDDVIDFAIDYYFNSDNYEEMSAGDYIEEMIY